MTRRAIRRGMALLLIMGMLFAMLPCLTKAAEVAGGECGANLRWSLDDKGVLTISGSGSMYPCTEQYGGPWSDHCKDIKTVVIKPGASNISTFAFQNCRFMTSIEIPESISSIDSFAFKNCFNLTHITLPNSISTIASNTFLNCKNLFDITFPESVTRIESEAFKLSGLMNLTIPDSVMYIGANAFYDCSYLTSVTIPDSVTSIENNTFIYCRNLTNVTIPESVTSIGAKAFKECTSLKSVLIPATVTTIGNHAIGVCDSKGDNTKPVEGFVLYGTEGSEAEKYAANNNLQFRDASFYVAGVKLDRISASVACGKTLQLNPTISPANAADKTVTWASSDPKVATVDANGKVRAVGAGTATITVTTTYCERQASCKITVPKMQNPMKVTPSTKTYKQPKLKKAKKFQIGVKNAQGQVTFTPDKKAKKAKIKVSKKGVVTIPKKCKPGTYKITVTAAGTNNYNPGKKSITIKVKKR